MNYKKKRLYLCCKEEKRAKLNKLATETFGVSVELVPICREASFVYVVGDDITREMERNIKMAKELKIPTVRVNENLINEDLVRKMYDDKIKVKDKNTERER